MKFLLGSSIVLLATAGAVGDQLLGPIANAGAVAVLGAALLIVLLRVIPLFIRTNREIAQQAHADSDKLNETLRLVVAHCSRRSGGE